MSNVSNCACSACVSLAWIDVPISAPTARVTTLNGMNRSKDETSMEHCRTHSFHTHSQILEEASVRTFDGILEHGTEAEKKRTLGELLLPLVQQQLFQIPYMAGKVTGMLLELDNKEILHLIASADALRAKIREALNILQAHQAQQMYQAQMTARQTPFHLP